MTCRYTYNGTTYSASEFMRVLSDLQPTEAAKFMPGVTPVPNAPFVNNTDDWSMLAFKRMVRHAAENGFDRIAWTTGEQQAERYDLSKQVDAIRLEGDFDQSIEVSVARDGDGFEHIRSTTKDGLAEIVGKEIADKAINGGQREFRGVDLKVGGEGMRGFYDKILPSAVNKWAKKFGGKVGQARLGGGSANYESLVEAAKRTGYTQAQLDAMPVAERKAIVDAQLPSVHAIDLTPSMRDAALQGMPLFNREDSAADWLTNIEADESRTNGDIDADRLGLRKAVNGLLGKSGLRVEYLRGYAGLPEGLRNAVESRNAMGRKGQTAALYDPETKRVFVFTHVVRTPERAAWNAAHEIAGHDGLRKLLGKRLDEVLRLADKNPTVSALADEIAVQRKLTPAQRLLAVEEALAELAAAVRTGDYGRIQEKYKIAVPEGIRARVAQVVTNFLRRLKELLQNRTGVVFKDADVRALLENAWQAAQNEEATTGDAAMESVDNAGMKPNLPRTRVVDDAGEPLLVYHSGKEKIDRFDSAKTVDGGFHFGTAEQAGMRAGRKAETVAAYLDIRNPRRSKDMGGNWKSKIASAKSAGHDGIVYLNRYEGMTVERITALEASGKLNKLDGMSDAEFKRAVPEARDSYIAFDDKQIIRSTIGTHSSARESTEGGSLVGMDLSQTKVVGEDGKPLTVFHGTPGTMNNKPLTKFAKQSRGGLGGTIGFWFATTRQAAQVFARERYAGVKPQVVEAKLDIRNPKEYDGHQAFVRAANDRPGNTIEARLKSLRRVLVRAGYDGVVIRNSDTDNGGVRDDWVAFEPQQIITQPEVLESTEDQTQSEAFRKWFGSSVVTETGKAGGKPLVVYHGGAGGIRVFEPERAGSVKTADWGSGVYFTPAKWQAQSYMEDSNKAADVKSNALWEKMEETAARHGTDVMYASMDLSSKKITQAQYDEIKAIESEWKKARQDAEKNGSGEVYAAYLRIENPLIQRYDGITDPYLRERAEAKGHDGIIIVHDDGSFDEIVVFRRNQIKSADKNNGNFDPDNDSHLESVEDDLFEVNTPETITAADLKIPGQIAVKREGVKGWLNAAGKKLTDLKPAALALVPLNHLADFASKGMTAVQQYVDQHYAMQAYRNGLYRDYDAIAQDWLKYASGTGIKGFLGKAATQSGRDLSDLMHDSTIAGIDPSVENASYKEVEKQRIYNELRARYMAMPEHGQALFKRVRDAYARQSRMLEEVIEANLKRAMEINKSKAERDYEDRIREIDESGASEDEKARLKANAANLHDDRVKEADQRTNAKTMALRATFESMRVEAPYFPLKRYGNYWVTVLKNGTMQGFSKFQTAEEQDAFVKQMKAQGFDVRTKYEGGDTKTHEMIDPSFIAEIEGILDGAQMPDSVKDDIWQAYLERMPDMSLRKSFIHRQKVQGYHPDALRAFSSTSFHGSYQLARLKYGMEMAETLDIAEKQAARVAPVQGEQLVGELRKRHAFIMNPTGGALAQGLTTAAFVYYLGANPAHLLLNATQTVMLGIPILGARYGFGRTTNALQKAMRDFAIGKGQLENANLTADERKAFQAFIDSGLIDKTQAHDLAGVGETGVEYNAVRQKVMNKIGWFFHQSERFNREVTAMAAYRLARQDGRSHDVAVSQAMRATYDIHFDYSAAARARVMQGDVAKSLLVFRNYQVNILYRLFRDIHQSLRGESVQVRREARKQLGAMMGMYGLFAGVAGMPFYGLAMALAGAFEDDDDPETAEQQFVRGTVELLGPDVARVLLKGVPGATFNIDLTDRIGMPNLWFRSPDRELEGRDAYYYWMEQVLGAGVGVIKQGYDGASLIFDGLQDANSGHVARGFEKMLPAAVRNVFKSVRYSADGVTTLNGEKILDLGAGGLVAQGLGYTPLDLAERYDANRDLKNANAKLERRRRALLDRLFLASQHGDPTDSAMLDIQAFNAKNPDYAITRQTIDRSAKLRNRNRLLNENGIVMTRRMRRLQERMSGSEEADE